MAMDWFSRDSLDGLAEGVNGSLTALALAVQGALEEAYANMEALEQRVRDVEQRAVFIRDAGDGALEVVPITEGTGGKGEEGADGNG